MEAGVSVGGKDVKQVSTFLLILCCRKKRIRFELGNLVEVLI